MMDKVATLIRLCILVLCAILFLAGALWNLCMQSETVIESAEITETALGPSTDLSQEDENIQEEQQSLEQRIAALRMERDIAWQQLYATIEQLDLAEKPQLLRQSVALQYEEKRLELLLETKNIMNVLVILGEQQANIIVPAGILQQEYEKLYDLVLRNTNYEETQIILVPLE